VIDPICNMNGEPASAAAKFAYEGQTYYFCSAHCVSCSVVGLATQGISEVEPDLGDELKCFRRLE
jgi:hypothetical protein